MSFLNPILLFGLFGVSVPILIHLMNKRRVERVWWGAMRFLQVSVEKNRRKLRLEDLLLLLVRCLVVALLALALSRPSVREGSAGVFGQARVTAVMVVDVSGSMSASDGVRGRMELARSAGEELLDGLPGGSRVALWVATDTVRRVIPEPTSDFNLVRRSLAELTATDGGSNLAPAVSQAVALLQRQQGGRKELLVVTDGQRAAFSELPGMVRELQAVKGEVASTVVLVGTEESQNLSLSELRQATGIAAVDRPLRFSATVTNHGLAEARDVRVVLRNDAGSGAGGVSPPVDEGVIEAIPAGQSRTVSLFSRLAPAGFHTVRAEIPGDRIPFDDARTVALRVVEQVRVLIIDGDPGSEPREAQSFFLRQALTPTGEDEASRWFVRAEVATASELATARLDDYDAVIIAGIADVSPATGVAIGQYLQRGGGVLLFPGPQTRPELLNRELLEARAVLPAGLEAARGDLAATRPAVTLSGRNLEHPIAAVWSDPASGNLASAGFFRRFGLKLAAAPAVVPGQAAAVEGLPRTVLLFSDGTPAVVERTYGQGRIVMFAFPATTQWGDLPVRPGVFVPLLYRSLGSVLSRQDEQLNIRVGSPIQYRPPSDWLSREVSVVTPRVLAEAKQGETRRVELVDGAPRVLFDATDFAGVYRLTPPEGIGAETVRFAAQPPAGESATARLSLPEREPLARVVTVADYAAPGALGAVTRSRAGFELFPMLALGLLLLAATEMGMAFWFSKPK